MRAVFLILLLLAACSDESISGYADPDTVYVLAELNGEPFDARATINFPKPGRTGGEAPCNSWSADQLAPYPWIELGRIAVTRRACPALEAEASFFEALRQVSIAEVSGKVLILSGDAEMIFYAEQ